MTGKIGIRDQIARSPGLRLGCAMRAICRYDYAGEANPWHKACSFRYGYIGGNAGDPNPSPAYIRLALAPPTYPCGCNRAAWGLGVATSAFLNVNGYTVNS